MNTTSGTRARLTSHAQVLSRGCTSTPSSSSANFKPAGVISGRGRGTGRTSVSQASSRGRGRGRPPVKRQNSDEIDSELAAKRKAASALSNFAGENRINVGSGFQASVSKDMLTEDEKKDYMQQPDPDRRMWCMPSDLDNQRLEVFLKTAQTMKHSLENAHFLLHDANYDFDRALELARTNQSIDEEWPEDDRSLFKDAFMQYGKNFAKVKEILPHRSRDSIINYYYRYKLDPQLKSYMEAAAAAADAAGGYIDDQDDAIICAKCGADENLTMYFGVRFCVTCAGEYKFADLKDNISLTTALSARASTSENSWDVSVTDRERQILNNMMKSEKTDTKQPSNTGTAPFTVLMTAKSKAQEQIAETKKAIERSAAACAKASRDFSQLTNETDPTVNKYRALANQTPTAKKNIDTAWTTEDQRNAVLGFVRYGVKFDIIATVMGTKTTDQVKRFYQVNQTSIDQLLANRAAAKTTGSA